MKIAVLGPKGTFCDKAYLEYAKLSGCDLEPVYCSTIDDVFQTVCDKEESINSDEGCELGIVPIENTLDGYVQRTLDLLLEKEVSIIAENKVEVQFSVVANTDSLKDVKKLYVQFKANGQCRKFINGLDNVHIIETQSNMESYYRLDEGNNAAAVVPRHIAMEEENNGSKRLVINDITDAKNNHTRFVVIKKGNVVCSEIKELITDGFKKDRQSEGRNKKIRIPIYVMPSVDKPGILFNILKSFYDSQINLMSIMSRPTKQELGTYNFYIEIDGACEKADDIADVFDNIADEYGLKILGVFKEVCK